MRVSGVVRDIHVKFASTPQEWEEAFQLVADNYQARGFEPTGAGDLRFTSYHALPDTVVLVAKAAEQVVATLSLVPDNDLLGLPLESLYREEIQELRRQGRRLFEGISLADRNLSMREFVQVFVTLMQFAWQHMTQQGADTSVITVNPRHSLYYMRTHGFALLGPRRLYSKVQGHPAEAYYLDPQRMRRAAPAMHERMFGQALPKGALAAPRLPACLARAFARRSSQTDVGCVERTQRYVAEFGSPRRW